MAGTRRWWEDARCLDAGIDLFFPPDRGVPAVPAAEVISEFCSWCPVRTACLRAALAGKEQGIWGGTTESKRRALLRGEPRAKCPVCTAPEPEWIDGGAGQVCRGCGYSWRTSVPAGHGFLRPRVAV